jgi:diguanylate cyclase (GGDEF)-like protein
LKELSFISEIDTDSFFSSKGIRNEQLDMFDKLDIAFYSADMYAWEADFTARTIRRIDFPSGKSVYLSFNDFLQRLGKSDRAWVKKLLNDKKTEDRKFIDIALRILKEGKPRWYKIKGTIYHSAENEIYASGVAYDIENTKTNIERIQYLRTHDHLTGLDNPSAFERADDSNCIYPRAAVIACIDNLREINESLGCLEGNKMIKNVAEVLKECFSDADFIVRIGGGEFCAVFSGKNEVEIDMKIKEANMMVHKTYLNLIKTEVSFGYIISSEHESPYSLYKQAALKIQRNRDFKRILSKESAVDRLNDIINEKTGWGKRNKRLQGLAAQIGGELGCSEDQINEIKALAKIADIGHVGIDDRLLKDRVNLRGKDSAEYLKHVEIGRSIIAGISEVSELENLYLDIYKRYDEWKDGIALSARIVAGAIGFDDISLNSSPARMKNIISLMEKQRGTKYCPKVVDALVSIARRHPA